jgi:hypothetical protein
MDDFNVSSLHESKNEWGARLLVILTPLIIEGFRSIFDEAYKMCKENREMEKYLMTFQNLITRIPKWNGNIIENETKRIIDKSCCTYLEDLVTCIHIIQLKLLTLMRVGQYQKKIDINIPKLEDFIHKIYINVARKIYKNVYLFEIKITPLEIQKNNRELEIIVQECILNTIRDSIPVETILKAYMDETCEEDVIEEIKEKPVELPVIENNPNVGRQIISELPKTSYSDQPNKLSFNNLDSIVTTDGKKELIEAPKDIERLEEISRQNHEKRKLEEMDDEDDDKISILDEEVKIDELLDINNLFPQKQKNSDDVTLDDIEDFKL